MSVLARKIARAKWERKPDLGGSEIAADAVTADLKTTGNTLSFWRCESSAADDLKRAVLALAAAADRPDRLDVVYLEEQAVRQSGLALRNTTGDTPVETLREHHVDVEKLDLTRLAKVAQMVADAHRSSASHTMTKKQVVDLVVHAVEDGLVNVTDLKEKMKEEVEARLKPEGQKP
jgi:hypothetical protein